MSLAFLIDGYNLAHALGLMRKQMAPSELESARRRLLDFLHHLLEPQASDITVVFDAKRRSRRIPAIADDGRIAVRFAGGDQEADDVIETLLMEHSNPRRLVVVSDDRRLKEAAARSHAEAWGCGALLDSLERRPAAQTPAIAAAVRTPPLTDAEVRHWLHEFHDVEIPDEYKVFLDPPAESE